MPQHDTTGQIKHHDGGTTFSGSAVNIFQAKVLASGLRLYAKTGIKPNRAYTPTNMLRVANQITGHNYRRGQYTAAAAALDEWCARARQHIDIS